MLPVAVANVSPSSRLRASARAWLRWLRPRAAPFAVAAGWLCAIVVGAQCTSRSHRVEVRASAVLPVPRPPVLPAPVPALAPVEHHVDPVPDTCESDDVL